jgi:hypothetical protein
MHTRSNVPTCRPCHCDISFACRALHLCAYVPAGNQAGRHDAAAGELVASIPGVCPHDFTKCLRHSLSSACHETAEMRVQWSWHGRASVLAAQCHTTVLLPCCTGAAWQDPPPHDVLWHWRLHPVRHQAVRGLCREQGGSSRGRG